MCFTKRTMMFYHMEIKISLTVQVFHQKNNDLLSHENKNVFSISSFFLHENKFQQVFLVFQGKLNPRGQKILNALEHFY